jgi:hypothetical protein
LSWTSSLNSAVAKPAFCNFSSEEDWTRSRAVNLDVTIGATGVLRVQVVLWAGRLYCADVMGNGVTRQTQLGHAAGYQHPRIGRAMGSMTRTAPFSFHWRMFVSEWTLFVRVTLHASRICASRQSRLFEFKTAVGIVAVATLHRSLKNLVMERQIELVRCFRVATQAKLRFARFQ